MLIDEWDYLKTKVGQIKDNANFYHTIGSILLGAAGSAVITALTTDYKKTADGSAPTFQVIAWALVMVFLICGILSLFFGRTQRKVENVMVRDVVQQMELMEQKYKVSGVPNTE
ncbi:MAG: hypothetical protein P4L69_24385 [Desulfosporosinus sp.]|nr:hypothetical protein [Desulfosporosinus sp.]